MRRRLLQAGAGAAALGAVPGASLLGAQAQGTFDWKRFKGEKIEVLLVKSPRGDLLSKYHKEFEDMTGIEVGSEMVPEQQQRQKAVIEFNSGNPSFDVIALSYHVQKRQFAKNNWLTDLRPMINDRLLADPNLDFADFAQGGLNYAVEADGRVMSLPLNLDPWVVYYNKELFAAKGVAFPKTFAQMIDAAAKLNDTGKGVSGLCRPRPQERQRAGVDELPARLRRRLRRQGRQADDRQPRSDRIGEDVPDAARQVRPAGSRGLQLERGAKPVSPGQGGDVARRHRLRAAARGSDQVAHRRQGRLRRDAGGPEAQVSALFADGEGISTYSKKKGPAWFYLQWASNKANQTRMLQAAAGAPVRTSAYAAAQASSDFKSPKEWVECMLTSAKIAQPGLPIIAAVTEFRDTFGIALTNMINGADPAAELKRATAEFQPVLDKTEKA